jgi:DNA-directed RNA polymerase specialized sigma24 family protein
VIDEQLLERIAGDPAGGLAEAIDRYGDQLLGRFHAYAARRGYGNAHVEDVWQDAFISLLDPVVRERILERGGEILPWLTKQGRWRLDDHHRHIHQLVTDDIPAPAVRGEDRPSPDVIRLRRVWPTTNSRDKLLLTWRYGESQHESEIADELGMNVSAAKKALHDARARLRRELDKDKDGNDKE